VTGTINVSARSIAVCGVLLSAGIGLCAEAARAAEILTKAPPAQGCTQAVDGVNGKFGGFGGTFANEAYEAAEGALAVPLGCALGAQLDLTGGAFDGRFLGTVAGHVFWRDPAQALFGAYGDFTDWNQFGGVRAAHVGAEGELYRGWWTLQGVTGVEFGNTQSATIGTTIQTFQIATRFFDEVNLAYYPMDNLEIYVGQRYLGGKVAAAFGAEWGIPARNGVMAALFAEGRVGEDSYHGVWGGLRFYFGHKDKTLIRRHREDDPTNWNNGPDSASNNGSQSPTPPPPPPPPLPPGKHCSGSC